MPGLNVPEHVAAEIVDGEAILLHLRTGKYFTLNPTATRVMELARGGLDTEGICQALIGEFEGDPQAIRADVERTVSRLLEADLLRRE